MRRGDDASGLGEPSAKRSKPSVFASHTGGLDADRPSASVAVKGVAKSATAGVSLAQNVAQKSGGAFIVVAATSAEQYLQQQQRAAPTGAGANAKPAGPSGPAAAQSQRPVTHLVLGGAALASEAAVAAARRRLGPALAAWGAGCLLLDEAWLTQLISSRQLPPTAGFVLRQLQPTTGAAAAAAAAAATAAGPSRAGAGAAPADMLPATTVPTTVASSAAAATAEVAAAPPAPALAAPGAGPPAPRSEGRFERWLGWWSPELDGMDEIGVIMQACFNDARCAAVGNAHIAAGLRELKAFERAVRAQDDEVGVRALAYARAAASVQACAFRIPPDLSEDRIARLLPFVDAACAAAIHQLAASGAAAAAAACGLPPPATPGTPYTPLSPPDVSELGRERGAGQRQAGSAPAAPAAGAAAAAAAVATPPRGTPGAAAPPSSAIAAAAAAAAAAEISAAAAAAAAAMAGATCGRLECFRRDQPVASSRGGLRPHTAGAATRRALTKLPGVGPSLAKLWYDAGIRSLAEAARRLELGGGGLPGGRPPASLQFALRHWADLTADVTAAEAEEMVAAVHAALVAAASPRHLRKAAAAAEARAAGASSASGAAASAAGAAGAAAAAGATPQAAAGATPQAAAAAAAAAGAVRTLAPGLSVGPTGWQVHCVGGGRRGRPSHDLDLMVCHPALASAEEMSQLFEAALEHLVASGRMLPRGGNMTQVQLRAMAGARARVQAALMRSRLADEEVGSSRSIADGLDHVFGVFRTAAGALKRLDLIFVLRPWLPHALVGWSGSTQFLRFLGQWASSRGLHRSNHALYDRRTLQPVAGIQDEVDLFRAMGLPYRAPEDRQCP
ncbi:hypothetical protein HXX76_002783 [Chlamydomonas incerta]|uniref:DNA polymerase beta thumb domain-containing protein n=1 Tax=Chlamydomonas incerta TaxID=51695 RepID=A0A835TR60_CHLIN|nr:hypothetical protein HXX76_002783 [Chlamydomonas incerta]|eukprot:KAG2442700.1 hypothetical protein HXX76_002783 [Chlamydomonas incerta]